MIRITVNVFWNSYDQRGIKFGRNGIMNITSNVGTERKRYLDAAKGWGITMVVFGHITSLGNPVDQWFGAYKLAIFYIVSGYLLGMRQSFRKMNTGQYVLKHFKSLMIPYFGYSAIVILYNILVVNVPGVVVVVTSVANTVILIASTIARLNTRVIIFLKCFITFPLFLLILNIFLIPGEADVCICSTVYSNRTAALSPVRLNLKFIC